MNVLIKVFIWMCFHFSWYIPRGVIAGLCGTFILNFFWNCQAVFQIGNYFFHSYHQLLRASVWGLSCKNMFTTTAIVCYYYIAILMDIKWYPIVVNSVYVVVFVFSSQVLGLHVFRTTFMVLKIEPRTLCLLGKPSSD